MNRYQYIRSWRSKNPDKVAEYYKKYKEKNKNRIKESSKKYRDTYPDRVVTSNKKWYEKNKVKALDARKKYYQKRKIDCPEHIKELSVIKNKRYRSTIHGKLHHNVSNAVFKKLRLRLLNKTRKKTMTFLPYTIDQLKNHLEKQFREGMSWGNYGKWHIDHIKPDCSFNYRSMEDKEFKKCWALNNLQPLWAIENLKKNKKI